jgi:SAM-dependent methyltransferase
MSNSADFGDVRTAQKASHSGGVRVTNRDRWVPPRVQIVMVQGTDYVIRGGAAGRERLRILSRIMYSSTASLFDRFGLKDGQLCLDIGCGGGDVTLELARRVGPRGKAVGADIDETQLDIARREVDAKDIRNVEFRLLDIRTGRGH